MATTPHVDPPKQSANVKAAAGAAAEKAPEKAKLAAAKEAPPQYPTLAPGAAWPLFYNGHRIAKQGDPPDKWISMGRIGDGVAVVQSPMTKEIEDAVNNGEYYHADDAALANPPPPVAATKPVNVDVPHVEAMGQNASCTMGNWNGEPTSYAYAWQRDGMAIPSATSSSYTMTSSDSGKDIGCIVTATNAAGSTAAPLSNTIEAP